MIPAKALKNVEIPESTAGVKLELRSLNEKDAEKLADLLKAHPAVETCDLTSAPIHTSAAWILMERCPEIRFHLTLDLYGGILLDNQL